MFFWIDTLDTMKTPKTAEIVQIDVHDMLSIMRFRCGDPLDADDYRRLDALMRPGETWPRRKEAPLISDLPKFAWNKRELGEQLSLTPKELEFTLAIPGCPTRRSNGRWPTQEIAQFMVKLMREARADER